MLSKTAASAPPITRDSGRAGALKSVLVHFSRIPKNVHVHSWANLEASEWRAFSARRSLFLPLRAKAHASDRIRADMHEHNGADLYFQRPEEEYCSLTMAHGRCARRFVTISTRHGSELNFASHALPFWSFSAASTPAAARQMRIDMLT
jgi:hypothetical protein